jgi:hypothetical protein
MRDAREAGTSWSMVLVERFRSIDRKRQACDVGPRRPAATGPPGCSPALAATRRPPRRRPIELRRIPRLTAVQRRRTCSFRGPARPEGCGSGPRLGRLLRCGLRGRLRRRGGPLRGGGALGSRRHRRPDRAPDDRLVRARPVPAPRICSHPRRRHGRRGRGRQLVVGLVVTDALLDGTSATVSGRGRPRRRTPCPHSRPRRTAPAADPPRHPRPSLGEWR